VNHRACSRGGLQRRLPTEGAAYGIPRNWRKLAPTVPRTGPRSVVTIDLSIPVIAASSATAGSSATDATSSVRSNVLVFTNPSWYRRRYNPGTFGFAREAAIR